MCMDCMQPLEKPNKIGFSFLNINIQYVIISYEKGVDKMAYTQAQKKQY